MSDTAEDGDTAVTLSLSPEPDVASESDSVSALSLDDAADTSEDTGIDYNAMTVTELKNLARERGIAGYSSMTKAELIASLTA